MFKEPGFGLAVTRGAVRRHAPEHSGGLRDNGLLGEDRGRMGTQLTFASTRHTDLGLHYVKRARVEVEGHTTWAPPESAMVKRQATGAGKCLPDFMPAVPGLPTP